ncbi:MAG: pur operon repressor [Clostridiales bacterium]|nr:pur operon repressor [Clostridiales bacterium]
MEHMKRSERLVIMTRVLTESPNVVHNLSEFCEMFDVAKSTVSEDIDLISGAVSLSGKGRVDTISGAAGGVMYRSFYTRDDACRILSDIALVLSMPGRLLPGGFLYTSDVASDPKYTRVMGEIVAQKYFDKLPDFVLTMETKGIPFALMTAQALNVPLVVARRDSRAYEGSAVKINYLSGAKSEKLDTMAISRRAVKAGQKALIVDDFAKGGGTLKGMCEMMTECQIEVIGVEVMIKTLEPKEKLCENVWALLELRGTDRLSGSCDVAVDENYMPA